MFGGKETGDGNSEIIVKEIFLSKTKYTIRYVPEGSEDEITKDEKTERNVFFLCL